MKKIGFAFAVEFLAFMWLSYAMDYSGIRLWITGTLVFIDAIAIGVTLLAFDRKMDELETEEETTEKQVTRKSA